MAAPVIDILMYHSISEAGGPTSIAPAIFASQMAALHDAGVAVLSLDDLVAVWNGWSNVPAHGVILTFDDGFQDFADVAWPILNKHGFRAIVYLPSGKMGAPENWEGAPTPPRPLMDWPTITALGRDGVDFGSHSVSHSNLMTLDDRALKQELQQSQQELQDRLQRPIRHFAPPYGLANTRTIDAIAQIYDTSVGTRLDQAGPSSRLHDLPRLEMFYYTDQRHWQRHLTGRGAAYLRKRQAMRKVGAMVRKPWA